MNSAEAAEEGLNDSDTDAFFKTGKADIVISTTWACVSIDLIWTEKTIKAMLRRKTNKQTYTEMDGSDADA